jgi:hypothetical protein
MSVIYAVDLLVESCTFRNTGGRGKYSGEDRLIAESGGTSPRAGVDFEPNVPTDVSIDVTFADVVADDNVDDAFDISADTNHSILIERCHALNCAGAWGSAFALRSLSAPGLVTVRDCSANNMPGAAIKIPPNDMESILEGTGLPLLVQNFSAATVATAHVEYHDVPQGWFPITVTTPRRSHHSKPLHTTKETMQLDMVQLRNISIRRGDRPFIACQNTSSLYGHASIKCDPARIWPLHGSVAVWVESKSELVQPRRHWGGGEQFDGVVPYDELGGSELKFP